MLNKELFNFQDKLYIIERKVKETQVKPEFINELKEYWGYDNVVKQTFKQTNESVYLFLTEVVDVEIIEEVLDN
jgi:hypothetical protein